MALIVDVGMHRGDDTGFYLDKGFDVLAVEAIPELVESAVARFGSAVEQGRLVVENIAIAERPGEVTFHASEHEGWGSLNPARAGTAHRIETTELRVRADTLPHVVGDRVPYYIKIDIEGADLVCVRQVAELEHRPRYLSFECDLLDREGCLDALRLLGDLGYTRFKLVNQAGNPDVRCPYPALEGDYVDARFTHYMSGPFGAESPGPWVNLESVSAQFSAVSRQQAVRAAYSETGRVLGVPVGRWHRQLETVYNSRLVHVLRRGYASVRGTQMGGWFDIHAAR